MEIYFVKNMGVCTFCVEFCCLMFINSTVCEDKQKNKTGCVLIEMTLLWGCVTVVDVENEYVLHII